MHSSKEGFRSQHQNTPSKTTRATQSDLHPSPYVSTLSHAFNISTPSSSKVQSDHSATLSTPTKLVHAASISQHTTPTRVELLPTPTLPAGTTRLLNLSGHEAFHLPGTPVSPWSVAPIPTKENRAHDVASDESRTGPAQIQTLPAARQEEQEWLMSGAPSSRTFNFFEAGSNTELLPAGIAETHASDFLSSGAPDVVGGLLAVTSAGGRTPVFGSLSSPFHAYREQPTSDPRQSIYESVVLSDGPTSISALSPTKAAALSPTQQSSAFPVMLNDGTFLSAIFEQGTPSLCTHLLPNSDLTEEVVPRGEPSLTHRPNNNLSSVLPRPFRFASSSIQNDSVEQRSNHSGRTDGAARPFQDTGVKSNSPGLFYSPGVSSALAQAPSAVYLQPPSSAAMGGEATAALTGLRRVAQPGAAERSHVNDTRDRSSHQSTSASNAVESTAETGLEGLGLNLNMAPTAPERPLDQQASLPDDPFMPSMLVDEMGRWMLDPEAVQLARSELSSLSEGGSRGGRVRWHGKDLSNASFGATTEGSFTSYSNSSTWDTSFNGAPSPISLPPSSNGESQPLATPASSIGLSQGRNPHLGKLGDTTPAGVDSLQAVATPEVHMHDFSEFGQSVSIEKMAEERWRTWPRNGGGMIRKDRPSSSALTMSPGTSLQLPGEERTSFDSLSVSASSTRSRLLAEPYNKNMRSGRPSSSASTSSRSSIGNAAVLETQHSSGVTGPTRPRSYIATGSLRMSSAARAGSSGTAGSDSIEATNERTGGAALALRRARGMSQGGHSSPKSSAAMKLTRSTDGLIPVSLSNSSSTKPRHSVALQRTNLSSDGLASTAQRPQSYIDTTAHFDSPRRLGKAARAKVGFGEVSVALDTLRMFLKQKEPGEPASKSQHGDDERTSPVPQESNDASSPRKPSRTLRRAKGVLPPRGAFSCVDEFGTLQPTSTSSTSGLNETKGAQVGHGHSHSLGVGQIGLKQTADPTSSSRQDDRLAVLEDLSERVRRLKAETERQKEQHAAESMPPPAAPLTSSHQRSQSSMTRREMHEEYLRKRGTGP